MYFLLNDTFSKRLETYTSEKWRQRRRAHLGPFPQHSLRIEGGEAFFMLTNQTTLISPDLR